MYWAALAACLRCYGCGQESRLLGRRVYLMFWSFWCFLVPYWTLVDCKAVVGAYALYKPLDQARALLSDR